MIDTGRKPIRRKIIIGTAIAAIGLAVSAVALFVLLVDFPLLEEVRGIWEEPETPLAQDVPVPPDVQPTQDVPVPPDVQPTQDVPVPPDVQPTQDVPVPPDVQPTQDVPVPPDVQPTQDVPATQDLQEGQLTDIIASPRIILLNDPGDSQRLSVQGYYSDGSVGELEDDSGAAFSYRSTDSSVAQVGSDGVVTAIKAGGADVVVGYGSFTDTVPILVWGTVRRIPPIDPDRLLEVSDDGSAIVLNRVMVELEPGYGSEDAKQVASDIGGAVVFEFLTFPGFLVEFNARTEEDLTKALAILQSDQRVALAYPDITMVASQGPNPIETVNLADDERNAYLDSGMEQAWTLMGNVPQPNLKPVVMVMIDTDFVSWVQNQEHGGKFESEKGQGLLSDDIDRVLNSEFDSEHIKILSEGKYDVGAHGSAVASIMVARNNPPGSGESGSFSGVVSSVDDLSYLLLVYVDPKKATDALSNNPTITFAGVAACLETIQRYEIDVVNLSIGTLNPASLLGVPVWFSWKNRLKELINNGMSNTTFVVAAGNDTADAVDSFPASLSGSPNVITVGNVHKPDNDFEWVPDSNFGETVTLGAPGGNIWVVDAGFDSSSIGYKLVSGTSYAAPLVSGTVALLKALDQSLTPEEIKSILVDTGDTSHNVSKDPGAEHCSMLPILDAGAAVTELLNPNPKLPPGSKLWVYEADGIPELGWNGAVRLGLGQGVVNMRFYSLGMRDGLQREGADGLDASTGERLWRFEPGDGREVYRKGVRYVQLADGSGGYNLDAVDAATGAQLWRYQTSGKLRAVWGASVYLTSSDRSGGANMEAVEAATGDLLWTYPTGGPVYINRVADGVVYMGLVGERGPYTVDFVDSATGEQLSRYQPGGLVYIRSIVDGVLYVRRELSEKQGNYAVEALDAATGEQLWHYPEPLASGEYHAAADGVVYLSAGGRRVDAVDNRSGERLWRYEHDAFIQFQAISDGVVYLEAHSGVVALDGATGGQLWRYSPPGGTVYYDAAADGVVYVSWARSLGRGSYSPGGMHALDAATGNLLWSRGPSQPAGPVIADGRVYVTSVVDGNDGYIAAVDATTGDLLWSHSNHGREHVNFQLADCVVFVTWHSRNYGVDALDALYAIDATTGEILWSDWIGLEGTVYHVTLGAERGVVYAAVHAGVTEGTESKLTEKVFLHSIQR